MSIKIGCDPEAFLQDGSGEFISAFGIIPGDKKEPYRLTNGAVQVDGMALEFNIDPVETEDAFVSNISSVLGDIRSLIREVDSDISISWKPIVKFTDAIWTISPEQCKILGCDPDYNISGEVNENPYNILKDKAIRTAAGHIHIGWLDELIEDPGEYSHFSLCKEIAEGFYNQGLKYYTPESLEEEERLKYYGHNGSWRPKRYGVELRSPSNLWVMNEKDQRGIFNVTRNRIRELTGL